MSNEIPMSKKKVTGGMKEKYMHYYERMKSEKHKELLGPKFDGLVKSPKTRHSGESRNPVYLSFLWTLDFDICHSNP